MQKGSAFFETRPTGWAMVDTPPALLSRLSRLGICFSALALASCHLLPPHGTAAQATLRPTTGNAVRGTVTVTQQKRNVVVQAELEGLTPYAQHGFHLHEFGDCATPDGSSAGGHFDPFHSAHGRLEDPNHHAGDMPNLQADGAGRARLRIELRDLKVAHGPHGVLGRSVIVHRDPDDYRSQPAGNSGPRIACGVIE